MSLLAFPLSGIIHSFICQCYSVCHGHTSFYRVHTANHTRLREMWHEKCNKNELAIYDTLTVSHQIFYTFCYSSDLHSDINLAMKITFVSNSFQTSLFKLKKGFATTIRTFFSLFKTDDKTIMFRSKE